MIKFVVAAALAFAAISANFVVSSNEAFAKTGCNRITGEGCD